jgi:hypothetical protein
MLLIRSPSPRALRGGEEARLRGIASRADERTSAVREGWTRVAEGRVRGAFREAFQRRLPLIRRFAPPSPRRRGEGEPLI